MKLIGNVRSIERLVAKRSTSGVVEEKRVFQLNIRPASSLASGDYAYCSLRFVAHGTELTDMGLDLDSAVDVYICPTNAEYTGKDVEDARTELALEIAKHAATTANYERAQYNLTRANSELLDCRTRITGLQLENVRLLTELTTLKQMMQHQGEHKQMLIEG